MAVFASLVVGSDGSTTKGGNSRGIASGVDRTAFLARRRSADFLLIGGQTARTEPYHRTPVPVVVSSRSMISALADNHLAHWWNLSPTEALAKGIKLFGPSVLVESGPAIINELIENKAIDGIYLSVTSVVGGEYPIDIEKLLANFQEVIHEVIDGTSFIEARRLK
ncbi:Bacterial bifunctional deaminase-reductase, C-terminal [Candidatus Nanopelagicaceae bacterium]